MVKAVIFDMDGTLVDSEPLHKIARDKVLSRLEIYSDELSDRAFGVAKREYWQKISDEYKLSVNGDEITATEFKEIIDIVKNSGVQKSKGIDELLLRLCERGVKMAVASSSDRVYVEAVINYCGWGKYFSAVVCGDEAKRAKPDPELYLTVLDKLGITAAEAIAVEDSDTGSCAAHSAGIACIGYKDKNTVFEQTFLYCRETVSDMREIINCL